MLIHRKSSAQSLRNIGVGFWMTKAQFSLAVMQSHCIQTLLKFSQSIGTAFNCGADIGACVLCKRQSGA
ncbi:Peptide transporter PTR2 [Fusarium oxysporum f. sp. albedinis]|nr:Peptide transporter PTR2 [Fusarium oxysporum f. sp. albedinis]